ncbi:MAG: esterase/lipase family protein [Gammaproteobacteria bacterium]
MQGQWLRQPERGQPAVVFVHGILSSGEACWRHDNGTYWPKLLQDEPGFESLGIYVYSYRTGFASGSYALGDVVDDLKERLLNLDGVLDRNPIIFVCHSMGGIVVRQFIAERCQDLLDRNIEVGLYLVASPSLGSDYANWLEPIAKAAGHAQAKALRFSQDNQWLNDLDKTFHNLKESRRLPIFGKELLEDKFVVLPGLFGKQVVERFSGNRYFGESYKVPGSDHCSIAKPVDKDAVQHRLLLKFIEDHVRIEITEQKFRNGANPFRQMQEVGHDKNEISKSDLQPWQNKLIDKLAKQLAEPLLSDIVHDFCEALERSDLSTDLRSLAEHLVIGQEQGDNRRLGILKFLEVAGAYSNDGKLTDPLYHLLAYLLQTLVNQCKIKADGLTEVPVERIQTLELINAAKMTAPLIPVYSEDKSEFKNGQRNETLGYVGDFQPPTGQWNVESVCLDAAKVLLKALTGKEYDQPDAIKVLVGRLSRYDLDPGKSPLSGIQIHRGNLKDHPFNTPAVLNKFNELTEYRLPIYLYGESDSLKAKEWLHTDEEKILGLIEEDNPVVEKYRAGQTTSTPSKKEGNTMSKNTPTISAGDHSIFNIVQGNQQQSQIGGQGNVQLNQQAKDELAQALQALKQAADESPDVTKQQYAELVKAADSIEAEVKKEQGADKGILKAAKDTLEPLKQIAGIAGSVEKIVKLLIPFIG